jgi:hypothetical protein
MENLVIQLANFDISGPKLYILLGLVLFNGIILFLVFFLIAKKISRSFFKNIMSFKQAVLLVSLPKYEVVEGSEKIQPKTQEELAEKIAVMESFFSDRKSVG